MKCLIEYIPLTKLLKIKKIFVILTNFVFFYSYIFERTHLKLAFLMDIYIYKRIYIIYIINKFKSYYLTINVINKK